MKKIKNEEIIEEHGWSILTNNSIIQEKESYFGNSSYLEIPINKIDSISRNHVFKKIFLVLAAIIFILGIYSYRSNQNFEIIIYYLGGIILSFILYIFTARKELIITAGNQAILEDAKKAGNFVHKLREIMYN